MTAEKPNTKTDTDNSGLYILEIQLHKACSITVGRLGTLYFAAGSYYYIGTAQKNLRQRVERHLRHEKKCRWHIDYLTVTAEKKTALLLPGQTEECKLARNLQEHLSLQEVNRFGSSDCSCRSHLLYSKRKRSLRMIALSLFGKKAPFQLMREAPSVSRSCKCSFKRL